MKNHIGCGYLQNVTTANNWRKVVSQLAKNIKAANLDFESIAFCGMSGALVAPTVAGRLGKTILMVRKDNDGSHSGCKLEGNPNTKNFIIVDDLLFTGSTINRIIETIRANDFTKDAKCVGIFLYNSHRNHNFNDIPVKSFLIY